ncbi:hypothetical protein IJ541_02180 [bacterium]|nr:hypothetical protein [bacterium]
MIKFFENMYDYYKYGKVVYKSKTSGKVVRKKVNTPGLFSAGRSSRVETKKTVLNNQREVERTIERSAYQDSDILSTRVKTVDYVLDRNTGIVTPVAKNKGYVVKEDSKVLTDYSKPDYDYSMLELPDGRIKYEIMYPETTRIVKGGPVTTTQHKEVRYVDKK